MAAFIREAGTGAYMITTVYDQQPGGAPQYSLYVKKSQPHEAASRCKDHGYTTLYYSSDKEVITCIYNTLFYSCSEMDIHTKATRCLHDSEST